MQDNIQVTKDKKQVDKKHEIRDKIQEADNGHTRREKTGEKRKKGENRREKREKTYEKGENRGKREREEERRETLSLLSLLYSLLFSSSIFSLLSSFFVN